MPSGVVMAVLYTRTALVVTLSIVKSAYYLEELINRQLLNFSLDKMLDIDERRSIGMRLYGTSKRIWWRNRTPSDPQRSYS